MVTVVLGPMSQGRSCCSSFGGGGDSIGETVMAAQPTLWPVCRSAGNEAARRSMVDRTERPRWSGVSHGRGESFGVVVPSCWGPPSSSDPPVLDRCPAFYGEVRG